MARFYGYERTQVLVEIPSTWIRILSNICESIVTIQPSRVEETPIVKVGFARQQHSPYTQGECSGLVWGERVVCPLGTT
jgi:hypothetical protein